MNEEFSLLSCLQKPATCLYPEPDEPSPNDLSYFLKIHFNVIFPSKPTSFKKSLSPFFLSFHHLNHICNSLLLHKRHIPRHPILLDLTTRIISGEELSPSPSLCNTFHNISSFYGEEFSSSHPKIKSWRTTSCRLSATVYSVFNIHSSVHR